MEGKDSVPAPVELFDSAERVAPERILTMLETNDLVLMFVMRAPDDENETVIDVWEMSDGAHFCCTPTVCYRLSAGVPPLLRLFPLLDSDWEVMEGDTQAAVQRLKTSSHRQL